MRDLLIVRYGEIALKGNNRSFFEKKLIKNIKKSLLGLYDYNVLREHGRVFIEFDPEDYEEVVERVSKVFGIVSISPAHRVGLDMDAIQEAALIQANEIIEEDGVKTFKVESRRSNKGFPLKSPEISREVGAHVLRNTETLKVDVHNPDAIINVEVRDKAYVYSRVIPCYGGMPYGTSAKAVVNLSGGIDSPVAAWLMAKRGVELEAVHFHSYPFTSDRALEKVLDLAKILTKYIGNIRVHAVNILEIQRAIGEHCPSEEMTILSRRFMMQISERIAKEENAKSIITGESIGQVASQTMEGLTVTNDAVDMPVFRPLIAMDKVDIIKIAEDIETFETSILPFEDCCTVFLPKRVVTKPRVDKIRESENLLDVETLIQNALEGRDLYKIENGEIIE